MCLCVCVCCNVLHTDDNITRALSALTDTLIASNHRRAAVNILGSVGRAVVA